ncbi:MAG: hypothetical protein QOG93_58, partial [Gaiellaceae bacterium]|nr:hypothetical protein [Gaiellaceae bacterium]
SASGMAVAAAPRRAERSEHKRNHTASNPTPHSTKASPRACACD